MITIISGSNRVGSNSLRIAKLYEAHLKKQSEACQLLSLEEVNMSIRNDEFLKAEEKYLKGATKFIIVVPEYNGSYSGILKLMIDNSDVNPCWNFKKVLLVGVSTGRAGNIRGMEHLTGCLLHIKMQVYHNRLPISLVHTLFDEAGNASLLLDTIVDQHVSEYLKF